MFWPIAHRLGKSLKNSRKQTKSLENKLNGAYTRMLHLMFTGLKELQIKNYTMIYQRLQKHTLSLVKIFKTHNGDMVKKLRTTCFFGCQKMEKTKEEGHRKHILTNSLKIKDYRWKNVKSWWPIEKGGNHSSTVIFRRDSTSEWVSEWVSEWMSEILGKCKSWDGPFMKAVISEKSDDNQWKILRHETTFQKSTNMMLW